MKSRISKRVFLRSIIVFVVMELVIIAFGTEWPSTHKFNVPVMLFQSYLSISAAFLKNLHLKNTTIIIMLIWTTDSWIGTKYASISTFIRLGTICVGVVEVEKGGHLITNSNSYIKNISNSWPKGEVSSFRFR